MGTNLAGDQCLQLLGRSETVSCVTPHGSSKWLRGYQPVLEAYCVGWYSCNQAIWRPRESRATEERPFSRIYRAYTWPRYFGLSWPRCISSSRNLHLCATKETLCAVRCFYRLTNTAQGETALEGTISTYFLADFFRPLLMSARIPRVPSSYLVPVTTKQMAKDSCTYM